MNEITSYATRTPHRRIDAPRIEFGWPPLLPMLELVRVLTAVLERAERRAPTEASADPHHRRPVLPTGRLRGVQPGAPKRRRPSGPLAVPLVELAPGDLVRLPVVRDGEAEVTWSQPVTIVSVVLLDTGMVQVRWEPGPDESPWEAHALLLGPAYEAGALRIR